MDNTSGVFLLETNQSTESVLNDEAYAWYVIVASVMTGLVGFLGVAFNAVNVIVYVTLGLEDSVNIALTGLSLAELGASLVLLVMSFFGHPDLSMTYGPVGYLLSWMHISFTRVASCLTAFVTLERYICVAMPLRVKTLITSGRTLAIVACIYVGIISSMVPPYFARKIESFLMPGTNRTIFTFLLRDESSQGMENISVNINNVTLLLAFVVVFVATFMIAATLQKKAKWRSAVTSASGNDSASVRDQKVVKMVTLIAAIFILSYLPIVMATVAMLSIPQYSITGTLSKLFTWTWGVNFFLEGANAASSIFVYLKMSSKFRTVFLSLFRFRSEFGLTRLH